MKTNNITKIFAGISIAMVAQMSFAGNITDINVSTLPDNQKIVKIRFDRDVASPRGFITTTPSRIALDFSKTNIRLPQPVLEYADPLLNRITAAQNNDRARILLGLNKAGQYNTEIRGQEVWVYVSESADKTAYKPVSTPRPATNNFVSSPAARTVSTTQTTANTNVDFHKGASNSGVIELSAPSFTGEPEIKQQKDRVIITLKNNPLPTQAQRSLDVGDFNTPVRNVTLKRIGNATQLVIRNNGNWDIRTKSSSGRYTFEIVPKSATTESRGLNSNANKSFNGRKISLDFQDVDVRTILQILAKESGTNIVASDSVNGKMTLSLKEVPWDQALDLVMQARNLDMRRQGNIINIAPREELLNKDKATLQAQKEIEELGPLFSQTFQLKYKNVEEFRKILRLDDNGSSSGNDRNTLLSSRGSALIDPATNTLIITDNHTVIQKFRKLIDELDVPTRQVMVEARIVEAEEGFSRNLGVKFGYTGVNGKNSWGSNWSNAVNNAGTNYQNKITLANAVASGSTTIPSLTALEMSPNISLPSTNAATNAIALVHSFASGALGLELSASEELGKSKTLSNPRVLTQDRKEATIEAGTEIPYQEATSSGATSVTFKKAVLGLTVTPNITPDGQIIMTVKINKDTPIDCQTDGLRTKCISTKNLNTQAMVEDGGTLIVGGIYEEENSNAVNKVPLLGDIPVVGNLFKSRGRNEKRRELLVFITPRIMDGVSSNLRY